MAAQPRQPRKADAKPMDTIRQPTAVTPTPASQWDLGPIPDPTVLTTQQLMREIAASRDLVEVRIDGVKSVIETRLLAMDKAVLLIQSQTETLPLEIRGEVNHLKSLQDERFASFNTQLIMISSRTEQTKSDAEKGIAAALQAQKEAAFEQSKNFKEQIQSITSNLETLRGTYMDKTNDVKELVRTVENSIKDILRGFETRIGSMEGHRKGTGDSWGMMIGVAGVATAIIAILVTRMH